MARDGKYANHHWQLFWVDSVSFLLKASDGVFDSSHSRGTTGMHQAKRLVTNVRIDIGVIGGMYLDIIILRTHNTNYNHLRRHLYIF